MIICDRLSIHIEGRIPVKVIIGIFMVLLLLSLFVRAHFTIDRITQWPDNKNGAVSLSFDDGCISQYSQGYPPSTREG